MGTSACVETYQLPMTILVLRNAEAAGCRRFAVAWYPAYRIPDAPLNGRFLTFHYISPQPQPPSSASSHRQQQQQQYGAYSLELPIAGLKLCNLHGERWFEPLSLDSASTRSTQQNDRSHASSTHSMPHAVQYTLNGLQRTAQYMARGTGMSLVGPKGSERLQQRHPDFEFFHTRH